MKRWMLMLGAAAAAVSSPAAAWNARGHMTVASIAWDQLDASAKARAIQLLRMNPDYPTWMSSPWVRSLPEDERNRIAFMEAATWPDDLRGRICSRKRPAPCIRDDRYTPPDPEADQNIGYRDQRLRRYWHFKDLGFSTDGTTTEEPFRVNAETQINFFAASLQQPGLGDEAKSFNLSWLLHLVGDVHQPLHATARFTATDRHGDGGGNGVIVCRIAPAVCVTDPDERPDTLHGLWDEAIGTSDSARTARAKGEELRCEAQRHGSFLSRVLARTNMAATPADWLAESQRLAIEYAYAAPIGPAKGPYFPTDAYRSKAGSISEQRVLIAGIRLGKMINNRLGGSPTATPEGPPCNPPRFQRT